MTELTEPGDAAATPSPEWPETSDAGVSDPVVALALTRLESLPHVPVAEHEAAYNGLHDELLAALNSDPEENDPAGSATVPGNRPEGRA